MAYHSNALETPFVALRSAPVGRSLRHWARRVWRRYWERRARRATHYMLSSLDDATLRDIGLSRSEIASAVYSAPGDRRHRYDARWRYPYAASWE